MIFKIYTILYKNTYRTSYTLQLLFMLTISTLLIRLNRLRTVVCVMLKFLNISISATAYITTSGNTFITHPEYNNRRWDIEYQF